MSLIFVPTKPPIFIPHPIITHSSGGGNVNAPPIVIGIIFGLLTIVPLLLTIGMIKTMGRDLDFKDGIGYIGLASIIIGIFMTVGCGGLAVWSFVEYLL